MIRKKKQNLKPSSILGVYEMGGWALFMDGIDHKDVIIIDEKNMTTIMRLVLMMQFSTKMNSIVHSLKWNYVHVQIWLDNGHAIWLHMEKVSWWMELYFMDEWSTQMQIMGEMNKMAWIKLILKSEIDHNGI